MSGNKVVKLAVLPCVVFAALAVVGCPSSTSSKDSAEMACAEPENPYDEGSGHYAGYKWAEENGGECEGNSDSFNEGCEEYYSQKDEYEACIAKQK